VASCSLAAISSESLPLLAVFGESLTDQSQMHQMLHLLLLLLLLTQQAKAACVFVTGGCPVAQRVLVAQRCDILNAKT